MGETQFPWVGYACGYHVRDSNMIHSLMAGVGHEFDWYPLFGFSTDHVI